MKRFEFITFCDGGTSMKYCDDGEYTRASEALAEIADLKKQLAIAERALEMAVEDINNMVYEEEQVSAKGYKRLSLVEYESNPGFKATAEIEKEGK